MLIFPCSRQYNRKKKAEPGSMCEDDLERVEMPIESMYPSTIKPDDMMRENGDMEDELPHDEPAIADLDEDIKKKPLVKLKAKTPAKAKPSKTLLQFSKKKRKRNDSEGSDADLDRTPPPSPPEEESGIEKRRSGRNRDQKRKKYVDDVQYNFSDEENKDMTKEDKEAAGSAAMDDILGPEGVPESGENSLGPDDVPGSGPNYAFIDPTAEDTMIVQIILASRTGTREVAEEQEEEVKKEEPKEEKPEKEDDSENKENKENGDIESEDKTEEDAKVPKDEYSFKDESDDLKKEETEEVKENKPEEKMETEETKEADKIETELDSKKSPSKTSPSKKTEPAVEKKSKTVEVDEYLVKFKNFSYLHCQWLTEEELLRGDKRVSQKVKRYIQKKEKSANMMDFCDDEPFNPDYVEVDRVLDSSVHTDADTKVSLLKF